MDAAWFLIALFVGYTICPALMMLLWALVWPVRQRGPISRNERLIREMPSHPEAQREWMKREGLTERDVMALYA